MGLLDFLKPKPEPLPVEAQPTKQCSKCKNPHPLDNFYKSKATKDGLQGYCKSCHITASTRDQKLRRKKALAKKTKKKPLPELSKPSRLQQYLEDTQPAIEIQLQDVLDDLDILATRVAFLQAQVTNYTNILHENLQN